MAVHLIFYVGWVEGVILHKSVLLFEFFGTPPFILIIFLSYGMLDEWPTDLVSAPVTLNIIGFIGTLEGFGTMGLGLGLDKFYQKSLCKKFKN